MSQKQTFRVRPEHITLLQNTYVSWDDCEFGAPSIDCKRPYGDSLVLENMAEILGVPMEENKYGDPELSDENSTRLHALHKETQTVLQIFLRTGSMLPGVYETDAYRVNWQRVSD
jgi:hypothetical protein